MPDRQAMARKHEEHVAEVLGGTVSKASGSTWKEKADGRNDHFARFAFAWDCKSTLGASISITRAMLEKLDDEAHGEWPLLPVRFYDNERLDVSPLGDRYLIREDDLLELLEAAKGTAPADDTAALRQAVEGYREQEVRYRGENAKLRDRIKSLEMDLSVLPELKEELNYLREKQVAGTPDMSAAPVYTPPVPKLPWTVIRQDHHSGLLAATQYGPDGYMTLIPVTSVRVEPVTATEVRIVLNDQVVRGGCDLYVNGKLTHRSGA